MVAIYMIFLSASSADDWLQLFLAEEQKSVNSFKGSYPIYFIYGPGSYYNIVCLIFVQK